MFSSKVMLPEEFRETGLLFEVNRLLLHLHGLALSVTKGDDGSIALEVLDARSDPEGCIFDEATLLAGNKKYMQFMVREKDRLETRRTALGFIVQPPILLPKGDLACRGRLFKELPVQFHSRIREVTLVAQRDGYRTKLLAVTKECDDLRNELLSYKGCCTLKDQ